MKFKKNKFQGNLKMKKNWINPQLIVLVRNRPEETFLIACKTDNTANAPPYWSGGGPIETDWGSYTSVAPPTYCEATCSAHSMS